jgi:phosphoglycerate dehydrogenase-like enzyme
LIAWVDDAPGREAMGPAPDGVRVETFPEDPASAPEREQVEFVVPDWQAVRSGFAGLPALRVVQTRSAGVDWIVERVPDGVTLCSARGARDAAMAEWVLWAILADLKAARTAAEQQAAREWTHLDLRDLYGASVLIVGHGSIGEAVEARLEPFGVRDVVRVARRARDGVHSVDELARLLPGADIVVNLLPATPQTNGLFDARMLHAMRDGALLVNGGRGTTVDTEALLRALEAGRVRAVLDVVEPEPLPADHPLWSAPGVILTPHSAGDTAGAERAAWALCGEQLRRYAAGESLRNVVREGY